MLNKITSRIYQKRKIKLKNIIGFGLTDFMGGGGQAVIGAWLLFFYTNYCNLSATQSTLIIGIGQIIAAISGVLIGGISDNFYRTKLGQKFGRRHFFLYSTAPLMFTFSLIWVSKQNFWYYLVVYCFYSCISMVMIPYETLPTEMTDDYEERTKLTTSRMLFSAIASCLATFIPGQLFKVLGTDTSIPFFINGLIFSSIFCLFLLVTAWNTWELPPDQIKFKKSINTQKENLSFIKEVKNYYSFFKVRSCRQHFGIYLFSFTGRDLVNMVFTFFCIYCLKLSATNAANLMSLSILGILVTLMGGYLFTRITPRHLYEISYFLILLAIFSFLIIYKARLSHPFVLMLVIAIFYQIASSLLGFVPWQVYAFLPDIDEIISKENRAGSLASLINLLRNITSAITTVLVGIFLDANHFIKGSKTQTLTAKNAIIEIMILGIFLIILAWLIAVHFNLNRNTHEIIVQEIRRLKGGGKKENVSPRTKNIVEKLTGYNYSDIWK